MLYTKCCAWRQNRSEREFVRDYGNIVPAVLEGENATCL